MHITQQSKDVKSWAAAARSGGMRDFCEAICHPRRILSVKLDVLPGNTSLPTLSAEHFHTWQPHSAVILYPVKILRLHWSSLATPCFAAAYFPHLRRCLCTLLATERLRSPGALTAPRCLSLTSRKNMCFFFSQFAQILSQPCSCTA